MFVKFSPSHCPHFALVASDFVIHPRRGDRIPPDGVGGVEFKKKIIFDKGSYSKLKCSYDIRGHQGFKKQIELLFA
jgi:hypothetical protein